MNTRYFIFSDVHGYYDILIDSLNKSGFDIHNKNHILISLGDLIDRGNQSLECIKFVNNLYNDGRAILIKGNHEELLYECSRRGTYSDWDTFSNRSDTIFQITGDTNPRSLNDNKEWIAYYNSCIDYYELRDYIFVHGWIPNSKSWRFSDSNSWSKSRWSNGMLMWYHGIVEPSKTIVCGHVCSLWGIKYIDKKDIDFDMSYENNDTKINHCEIFKKDGIIAIDSWVYLSNKLNILIIDEE